MKELTVDTVSNEDTSETDELEASQELSQLFNQLLHNTDVNIQARTQDFIKKREFSINTTSWVWLFRVKLRGVQVGVLPLYHP